jgi:predicted ATPase
MIIKIKNLGIVEEARVDLGKDLIILTGENNTGKTYVAYTLYQLLNLDHEKFPGDIKSSSASISNSIGSLLKEVICL